MLSSGVIPVGCQSWRVCERGLTERGEYLAEILLRDPTVLVVVDELERFFELLNLCWLEERKQTGRAFTARHSRKRLGGLGDLLGTISISRSLRPSLSNDDRPPL